jgi:medium-chain acyl-[acyl-carrier-protein] hydrolase
MADNIYITSDTITTSDVGPSLHVRFSAILCLMQDAASVHAEKLGLGFDYMSKLKRAFVLSRMQIKVCANLPSWGETIKLTTWPRGVEKLFAYRDFELARESGEPFMRATTSWLMLDTEIRHLARPEEYFINIVPRNVRVMDDEAPRRLGWESATQPFDTRRARASDLDPNGHVNNTRYIDWVTDAIAERHGLNTRIAELSINFLAEIRMSEAVKIGICEEPSGEIVIQGETDKHSFAARVTLAK